MRIQSHSDVNWFFAVAVKRYYESQVRASKGTSPEEGKKKRVVSRRTKVCFYCVI